LYAIFNLNRYGRSFSELYYGTVSHMVVSVNGTVDDNHLSLLYNMVT